MLKERVKREYIASFEADTILDLLNHLPKRLLESIVRNYKLTPTATDKHSLVLCITEHRKLVYKSLKFTFSYANLPTAEQSLPEERNPHPSL